MNTGSTPYDGRAPSPHRGEGGGEGAPARTRGTEFAKRLRRNQTDAERKLWFRLRDRRLDGWKFKRQVPIDRYIVDFCCADAGLIVELDGGQHTVRTEQDRERTRVLESVGYLVLRFWNNDVLQNAEGVLQVIHDTITTHLSAPPHPSSLPSRSRMFPTSAALGVPNSGKPELGGERGPA